MLPDVGSGNCAVSSAALSFDIIAHEVMPTKNRRKFITHFADNCLPVPLAVWAEPARKALPGANVLSPPSLPILTPSTDRKAGRYASPKSTMYGTPIALRSHTIRSRK